MLISREYELVNRFILLKCTLFEDIHQNTKKLMKAEDTAMSIQKFYSNAAPLMHVVGAYALMLAKL